MIISSLMYKTSILYQKHMIIPLPVGISNVTSLTCYISTHSLKTKCLNLGLQCIFTKEDCLILSPNLNMVDLPAQHLQNFILKSQNQTPKRRRRSIIFCFLYSLKISSQSDRLRMFSVLVCVCVCVCVCDKARDLEMRRKGGRIIERWRESQLPIK